MIYVQLFLSFLQVGMFSVGGGGPPHTRGRTEGGGAPAPPPFR